MELISKITEMKILLEKCTWEAETVVAEAEGVLKCKLSNKFTQDGGGRPSSHLLILFLLLM